MIKEYKTIKGPYGIMRKVVVIICDSCGKEFNVFKSIADEGRKYCSRECLANNKGFHMKDIVFKKG